MEKKASLDQYIDQALEEQKAEFRSQLEPFEVHAAKLRQHIHTEFDRYAEQFLHGYTLLAPISTNDEAIAQIDSFEKVIAFISEGKSLWELFGYTPDILVELYQKAYKMVENHHYDDGHDAYLFIVTVAPHFREAWLNLGYCLCKQNKQLEGIEAFGNALKLDPTCADSYLAAAGAYLKLNDKQSALQLCDYGIEEYDLQQLQEAKIYIEGR